MSGVADEVGGDLGVAAVKLAVGGRWSQMCRAKCVPEAAEAAWETLRSGASVADVVSNVVHVAVHVAKPGGRPSYRIFSGHRGPAVESIGNSRGGGREKIRRFLIVMALAGLAAV